MAFSTTSTFGSNNRVLSVGNPILFRAADVGGNKRILPAIVYSVSATGPTLCVCVDPTADPPSLVLGDGVNTIPFDDLAETTDDLRVGYWMPVPAPPIQ